MRKPRRFFLVLFVLLSFGVSLMLQAEEVLEAPYDESETLPYEGTPLFSIVVPQACGRIAKAGVRRGSLLRFSSSTSRCDHSRENYAELHCVLDFLTTINHCRSSLLTTLLTTPQLGRIFSPLTPWGVAGEVVRSRSRCRQSFSLGYSGSCRVAGHVSRSLHSDRRENNCVQDKRFLQTRLARSFQDVHAGMPIAAMPGIGCFSSDNNYRKHAKSPL